MDLENICINCFNHTGGEEVCMHCGFVQVDRPKQICHLYPHTILYDRYIIGKVINNGGFGVVYKAYDTRLENVVAIKELLPTQNSMVTRMPPSQQVIPVNDEKNEQFQNLKIRFMEEARVMAQFSSCESIVQIYDFFETNNTAYLVMEYLDGQTLREKLNKNSKKVSYDEAVSIMMPIMEALKTVHEKDVIHKDVSPDNIFLCNDGRVKLIDFGAAKFGNDPNTVDINSVIMKPGYTPPEQYRANGVVGAFSDVYSVGAVWYAILSGEIPEESIDRINKDQLEKLQKLGVDLPIHVEKSIMKAMALKETARFKTMDDFIRAINGQKKADYPEVELKKKKIWRAVFVTFIFAMMVAAVVTTYVVKKSSSIIPASSTTITVWYSDDGNADKNARWKSIAGDFKEFMKKQNEELAATEVEVVAIPSDEYEDKLDEAFANGTAPDIYQLTDTKYESNAESLARLYKEASSSVNSDAFKVMSNTYKQHNSVAVCFDVPVLYTYTDNTGNKAPEKTASLDDLINAKRAKNFNYTLICNPDTVVTAAYAYGFTGSDDMNVINKLYEATKTYEKDKLVAPQSVFTASKNNAMYYIGYMSEFSEISRDIRLGSKSFAVDTLTGENTMDMYVFPEVWCINEKSSHLNKTTSELFLYFILCTEDGQTDTVRVNNNTYYLPMLNDAIKSIGYEEYDKIYDSSNSKTTSEYEVVFENNDKSEKTAKAARKDKPTDYLKEIF